MWLHIRLKRLAFRIIGFEVIGGGWDGTYLTTYARERAKGPGKGRFRGNDEK